jgi:hypothetical protein
MYTISVDPHPTMGVNIHNRCSDFKLTGRTWLKRDVDWCEEPYEEVNAGSKTSIYLRTYRVAFEGGLMYQLQRKSVKSDDQLESTYTLLFITWRLEGYNELRACIHLLECDKQIEWNQHKLEEYRQRYHNQLSTSAGSIKDTWLIHDGTVLMTSLESDFTRRIGVLNVTISEGSKDVHTRRPVWINLER